MRLISRNDGAAAICRYCGSCEDFSDDNNHCDICGGLNTWLLEKFDTNGDFKCALAQCTSLDAICAAARLIIGLSPEEELKVRDHFKKVN